MSSRASSHHRIIASSLLWLFIPAVALAQPSPRVITVVGEASKEIVPNEAALQVVISAQNRELKQAKLDHDRKLESLFTIAGELQIERKHLKTQYASVQPVYRYNNNERVFEGYEVASHIEVTVVEPDRVGLLMENLISAKFENIGNVEYRIDNDLAYRDAVLLEALDNARDKAAKLAERAGGDLGDVLRIAQGVTVPEAPQPMFQARAMKMEMAADAGGGIAPPAGVVRIDGAVTVTYELK